MLAVGGVVVAIVGVKVITISPPGPIVSVAVMFIDDKSPIINSSPSKGLVRVTVTSAN